MLTEIERHDNCTVIICQDDQTGEIDVSWFENSRPPKLIITDCKEWSEEQDVMYKNGAVVNTAFLTNLDPEFCVRTAPELRRRIVEADRKNRAEKVRKLTKYSYPPEVLTATMVGYLGKYGQDFRVPHRSCSFIRALESQKKMGKAIFGSGYLLSEKAAAEKAAAEKAAAEKAAAHKWELSADELAIIRSLD